MEVARGLRVASPALRFQTANAFSNFNFPEGRYIKDFPGYIFYADKNRKGSGRSDRVCAENQTKKTIRAPRGRWKQTRLPANQSDFVRCPKFSLSAATRSSPDSSANCNCKFDPPKSTQRAPKIDDMTFTQLCESCRTGTTDRFASPTRAFVRRGVEGHKTRTTRATEGCRRAGSFHRGRSRFRSPVLALPCWAFRWAFRCIAVKQRRHRHRFAAVAVYYSFVPAGAGARNPPGVGAAPDCVAAEFCVSGRGRVLLGRANRECEAGFRVSHGIRFATIPDHLAGAFFRLTYIALQCISEHD